MKKFATAAILSLGLSSGLMLASILAGTGGAVAQTTISLSCGSAGIEFQVCKSGGDAWAKATGNQINFVSTPNDSNERLALYQQLLAAKSGDIDVFQIDVVWPGILANHLIDL